MADTIHRKRERERVPPEQGLEFNEDGHPVYVRVQTRREAARARDRWDRWARRNYDRP